MNEENQGPPQTMSPEEFRVAGYQHIDWITSYFEQIRNHPVLPKVEPGDLTQRLPKSAPEQGEPIERILEDFNETVFPGLTLWNHPRFFAWFANSSSPPSILAELLTAAVNVNVMLWKSSPSATELEQITLGWLRQWLQLSETFFGIIYDTASVGVLQAIGAAREWKDPDCRVKGMKPGMTVYVSEHTHSSAEKAAITLGFGQENIRKIGVDERFRMRPELLEEAIGADIENGKTPCCVVATVGTTSITSIDPVPAIATIAERYGVWLHVDAAYGGPAAIVPEMRHILDGAERAHSLILNPHKWLFVSMDCSVSYTRFPDIFKRASSLSAEYLKTAEDAQVVNYNDYGVQLGRRFRALKLWYVMRYYGHQGVVALLRESLRLAQWLAGHIQANPDFELCAPVVFSLVCFRHKASNAVNQRTLQAVNETGHAFLSHTVLNGKFVLRLSIGNMQTNQEDVRSTWDLIARTAAQEAAAEEAMAARQ
jgi:aromatic-L-amino-acid/L-tryptophan decarboxylase